MYANSRQKQILLKLENKRISERIRRFIKNKVKQRNYVVCLTFFRKNIIIVLKLYIQINNCRQPLILSGVTAFQIVNPGKWVVYIVNKNYPRIFPSTDIVTTLSEIDFPLISSAFFAAYSIPPQHGTSIRTTVMLVILFCDII